MKGRKIGQEVAASINSTKPTSGIAMIANHLEIGGRLGLFCDAFGERGLEGFHRQSYGASVAEGEGWRVAARTVPTPSNQPRVPALSVDPVRRARSAPGYTLEP
jgi:hypothetical protein